MALPVLRSMRFKSNILIIKHCCYARNSLVKCSRYRNDKHLLEENQQDDVSEAGFGKYKIMSQGLKSSREVSYELMDQNHIEGPEDFFGIESDVNVKHFERPVEKCTVTKHFSELSDARNPETKNVNQQRLVSLPFGEARFDVDNTIKRHGQYDLEFDDGNRTRVENFRDMPSNNINELDRKYQLIIEREHFKAEIKSEANYVEEQDDLEFDDGNKSRVENSRGRGMGTSQINELDRKYQLINKQEHFNPEIKSETNYIEEQFFPKTSKHDLLSREPVIESEAITHTKSNFRSNSEQLDPIVSNSETNLFDQQYFNELELRRKNIVASSEEVVPDIEEPELPVRINYETYEKDIPFEDRNFFDEQYFRNIAEHQKIDPESNISNGFKPRLTNNDHNIRSNMFNDHNPQLKRNDGVSFVSVKMADVNQKGFNQTVSSNSITKTFPKINEEEVNDEADTFGSIKQKRKQQNQTYFSRPKEIDSSIDISETNLYPPKDFPVNPSGPEKFESKNNLLNETQENPRTAYDFVMKLRMDEKNKKNIKSDSDDRNSNANKPIPQKSLKGEKLDSKGFRILSDQVQDLSKIPQTDVLTILKHSVLYNDNDIFAINKPYGITCQGGEDNKYVRCMTSFLPELAKFAHKDVKVENSRLHYVHRLDRDCTGVLLFAKTKSMAKTLSDMFAENKIIKKYWALTKAIPEKSDAKIDIPICEGEVDGKRRMVLHPDLPREQRHLVPKATDAKRAVTHYNIIETRGDSALLEIQTETGLKHQIRVHLGLGIRCPILGDHKYTYLDKIVPQKLPDSLLYSLNLRQSKVRYVPLHLHAKIVVIPQILDGKNIFIKAPLPAHFDRNLRKLCYSKNLQ